MSDRVSAAQQHANSNKSGGGGLQPVVGVVLDIILDDVHADIESSDSENISSGKNVTEIGWCHISIPGSQQMDLDKLTPYPPYDALSIDLPLKGERVLLIPVGNTYYYKRISSGNLNVSDASVAQIERNPLVNDTEGGGSSASSYNKTAQTGITNSKNTNSSEIKIGEYFEQTQTNRLKLYEGDRLIQSRFGQSIRFSGYNNSENKFAPTIIIRNRQYDVAENDLEKEDMFEEDLNRDGSTIALVSGDHKLTFQPGIIDDGGSSNFETTAEHFDDYPKELVGKDQILINSERLIFSSKSAEMLFYSKGNYGFISDGKLSIDNGKAGAELDFNGDVRITTNDNNTYILGNDGKIFLNIENENEPLVRGEQLVGLLTELIDLLVQQVFPTPSGPTAVGPTNQGQMKKIQSKLETILSTKNFTE